MSALARLWQIAIGGERVEMDPETIVRVAAGRETEGLSRSAGDSHIGRSAAPPGEAVRDRVTGPTPPPPPSPHLPPDTRAQRRRAAAGAQGPSRHRAKRSWSRAPARTATAAISRAQAST